MLDVVSRSDSSVAARAMITAQDGSIHLLRNNEHSWTREESLAHVSPLQTVFMDLSIPDPEVQLNVSAASIISAYITRVQTHIKQLRNLPSGLYAFARHFATGRYEEIEVSSTNRDAFGLRKFIIVATDTGKLLALDSANGGNIVWRKLFDVGSQVYRMWVVRESNAVRGQPPLVGVILVKQGSYYFFQINGLDGTIVSHEEFLNGDGIVKAFSAPGGFKDNDGRTLIIYISEKGVSGTLPTSSDTTVFSRLDDKLYYSIQESDAVQGYAFHSVRQFLEYTNHSLQILYLLGVLKSLPIVDFSRYHHAHQTKKSLRSDEFSEIALSCTSISTLIF